MMLCIVHCHFMELISTLYYFVEVFLVRIHGCSQNHVKLPSLRTLEQVLTLLINPHEHISIGMQNLVHAQSSCQQA